MNGSNYCDRCKREEIRQNLLDIFGWDLCSECAKAIEEFTDKHVEEHWK